MKTGWIIFGIIAVVYLILSFINPHATLSALKESFDVLKMIIPIILVVFFLMALLNGFIRPQSVTKHLGKDSGIKAWIIALVGGILSHGPAYIWYPILQDFRQKGVQDGIIISFLYARSIKIPWLPVMISYFGVSFTIILSFYILLGALIQGMITNKFE